MIPVAVSLVDDARGLVSLADRLKLSWSSGIASLLIVTKRFCVVDGWELAWNVTGKLISCV